MPTTVVNKYKDKYDVYIGRPSKWGNPFSHKEGTLAQYKVATRKEAVDKYAVWIMKQPELLKVIKSELKNKRLACYCAPLLCHGNVLARMADTE